MFWSVDEWCVKCCVCYVYVVLFLWFFLKTSTSAASSRYRFISGIARSICVNGFVDGVNIVVVMMELMMMYF